jgi:hypothetical protein
MRYIVTLLLVISAGAFVLGSLSYIAVGMLILINLFKNKLPLPRYFCIIIVVFLFVLNLIRVPEFNDFDYVALNFALQLIFLLSVDYRDVRYCRNILLSLKLQIAISVAWCAFGLLTGNMTMFVDAGSAKGFNGLYALRGIYSTPQLLASVCLAVLFFSKYNVLQKRSTKRGIVSLFTIMVASLNRVNIISLIALFFVSLQRHKNRVLVYALNSLLLVLVLTLCIVFNIGQFINFQTIESRNLLIEGVVASINFDSIAEVLLGSFGKINFYIPQYIVYISYVENGLLFLLKYYGVLGLLSYIIICSLFVYKLFKQNHVQLAVYAFLYLFVVQNFTNEYLVTVFPEIIALMLFVFYYRDGTYNKNDSHPSLFYKEQ